MQLSEIQGAVRELATLEKTENAFLSCYVNLQSDHWKSILRQRLQLLESGLTGMDLVDFRDASDWVQSYLEMEARPRTSSVAIFCRAGKKRYFKALQFSVPLPNWITRSSSPNIYHLVELMDTYHRYVLLIIDEAHARILEINLGAITEQLWAERRELRERVGRDWTRGHYQLHRTEKTRQFMKEIVRHLQQLMVAGGHTHLIIAGKPPLTSIIERELGPALRSKLIDIVPVSPAKTDIVAQTIRKFVEREEVESQQMASLLFEEISTGGLAVAGAAASFRALRRGQADVLVILNDFNPGVRRYCPICMFLETNSNSHAEACPRCHHREMKSIDIREELVRLAEQQSCKVEVVNESNQLKEIGGIGCLLRYWLPDYEQWVL